MDEEYWGPAGSLDDQIKAKERLADYHKERAEYYARGLTTVTIELARLKKKRSDAMAKARESFFISERTDTKEGGQS
jgi:hypothetical protein